MKHKVYAAFLCLGAAFFLSCPNPMHKTAAQTAEQPEAPAVPPQPVASDCADLKLLSIGGGFFTPLFSPAVTEYRMVYSYDRDTPPVSNIIVLYGEPLDPEAVLCANNGRPQRLFLGDNTLSLTVTARDKKTRKTYTLHVLCADPDDPKNKNDKFKSLTIDRGTLEPLFTPDGDIQSERIRNFSVSVPHTVKTITIHAEPDDPRAIMSLNSGVPQPLAIGENSIVLRITPANGRESYNTKHITVTRETPPDILLSDIRLSTGSLDPPFSPKCLYYIVNVPYDTKSLTATGTGMPGALVGGDNGVEKQLTETLTRITLPVTLDGETLTYEILVNRGKSFAACLAGLEVQAETADGNHSFALNPVFNSDTEDYTVYLPESARRLSIRARAAHSADTVKINRRHPSPFTDVDSESWLDITQPSMRFRIRVTSASDTSLSKDYTLRIEKLGFKLAMVPVPAGEFSRDGNPNNKSRVSAFEMSECEITRAQFKSLMKGDPSDTTVSTGMDDPVQGLDWREAIAFCNKLSIWEGRTPAYNVEHLNFLDPLYTTVQGNILVAFYGSQDVVWKTLTVNRDADGYRLPTEAEWMWAAMGAQDKYDKPFAGSNGSNSRNDYIWYAENSGGKTQPVKIKLPNERGLYDMSGNVAEWCFDAYAPSYPDGLLVDHYYQHPWITGATDWFNLYNEPNRYRIIKGGAYNTDNTWCTVSYRGLCRMILTPVGGEHHYNETDFRQNYIGFRVVRNKR